MDKVLGFFKKPWVLMLIIGLAIFRWRNDFAGKMSGLPAAVKSFLKISGFVVPIGFALLYGSSAFAGVMQACGGHVPCGAGAAVAGWLKGHAMLATILTPALTALGFAAVGLTFNAPDTLDLQDSQGGRTITYTPAATAIDKSLFINVSRLHDRRGRPLVAKAITIKVVTTVTQPATGAGVATIYHDDLNRLVESISIESPLLGTLLDRTTGQGPVLGLLISYLGQGFNGTGDQGVTAIVPSGSPQAVTVTKYFTYPIATEFLFDPDSTGMYLAALDKTEIKVRIAANTALAAVSTGTTISGAGSTISGVVSYVPHSDRFVPNLSYYRLDTPASGSDGMTFRGFGDKGPRASLPVDYLDTIAVVSNLKGLPGNQTIDNITRIIAEPIGLDDVVNMDMLINRRVAAQRYGASGRPSYTDGGNWAMGTTVTTGGMGAAGLLSLNLLQPSLDMRVNNALVQPPGSEIKIRCEYTTPRTGADAFLFHSTRKLQQPVLDAIARLYGWPAFSAQPRPVGVRAA